MSKPDDHFSALAKQYARGRIGYPAELTRFLVAQTPSRALVWDCATGTGQAALDLAPHFQQVVATDLSQALLDQATPHPRITYRCATAENSGLPDASADLITVAQAIHWFDLEAFWREARRVLRPDGILAFWGYTWPRISPEVDAALACFNQHLTPYWPEKIKRLHDSYKTVNAPASLFTPLPGPTPEFQITVAWTLENYLAHLRSWSATRYHREATGTDALEQATSSFAAAWGSAEARTVVWEVPFKIYRCQRPESG